MRLVLPAEGDTVHWLVTDGDEDTWDVATCGDTVPIGEGERTPTLPISESDFCIDCVKNIVVDVVAARGRKVVIKTNP